MEIILSKFTKKLFSLAIKNNNCKNPSNEKDKNFVIFKN